MQFGPSLDKRKVLGLVRDTPWNGFLELNRMAFSPRLPRNSESRALAIAFRLIRKHYPHIQWVVSFADGTQSGDGTIYRAAGFVLTSIKKNTTIWSNGEAVIANISVHINAHKAKETLNRTMATDTRRPGRTKAIAKINRVALTAFNESQPARDRAYAAFGFEDTGAASMKPFKEAGFRPLPGFQLRYIYFLDPTARERLTVPIVPFSKIEELGAGMYLGQTRGKQASAGHHPDERRGSADPHAPDQAGPE